jgi:hypothetical protein
MISRHESTPPVRDRPEWRRLESDDAKNAEQLTMLIGTFWRFWRFWRQLGVAGVMQDWRLLYRKNVDRMPVGANSEASR